MQRFNCRLYAFLCAFTCIFSNYSKVELPTSDLHMQVEEKLIVVIIPSYNNQQWYQRNLDSVLCQNYENFHVIYIDDISADDTYQLVRNYIDQAKQQDRVTVIQNKTRQGALANLYYAIHDCSSNVIIVTLDGDDWFKNENVLATINKAYADPNVWMTYGQFEEYPEGKIGFNQKMPEGVVELNVYREYLWITSHLRTFYAGLFHKIKLEDLIYRGKFFQVTWDQAFMIPMLEMAAGRWKFISDVLYVYNQDNPINDYKVNAAEQIHCEKVIRSKSKYQCLAAPNPFDSNDYYAKKADLFIFSQDKPAYLFALLETAHKYVSGLNKISVFYTASNGDFEDCYENIQNQFPSVVFIKKVSNNNARIFAKTVVKCIEQCSSDYVMFAHDGLIVKDNVDVPTCIQALEKTHAFGFYLTLGNHVDTHNGLERHMRLPAAVNVRNNICAWQFKDGEFDWRKPHNMDMTLYRKNDIMQVFAHLSFDSVQALQSLLDQQLFDFNTTGLFFENSKVICLQELQHVEKQDLLTSFKQGKKIDTKDFAQIKNRSVALQVHPYFIVQSQTT